MYSGVAKRDWLLRPTVLSPMRTTRTLLVAATALSMLGAGCDTFCTEEVVQQYHVALSAAGSVSAPPVLGFNGPQLTDTCGDWDESVEGCIMGSAGCAALSFTTAMVSPNGATTLALRLDLSGLPYTQSITLPDQRAQATAWVGPTNGSADAAQVIAGTVTVNLKQNHFEASFVVDILTSDGTRIHVSDGRCTEDGHFETACVAD